MSDVPFTLRDARESDLAYLNAYAAAEGMDDPFRRPRTCVSLSTRTTCPSAFCACSRAATARPM